MKLLVLGATGPLGRLVVARSLERGHDVTAFTRARTRVFLRHERLRIAEGDAVTGARSLRSIIAGQDAVVSALGVGNSFRSQGLMARSAPNLLAAMEEASVKRLVWVSAFGVGETRSDAPLLARAMFHTLLADIYADKRIGEEAVTRSALDWTIVAPVMLTNGPRTGRCRTGEHLDLRGMPRVSRADVAEVIVGEVEAPRYLRKTVLVAD